MLNFLKNFIATCIGLILPLKFTGKLLLKEQFKLRGIPIRHIDHKFFDESFDWIYAQSLDTKHNQNELRTEVVETILEFADVAAGYYFEGKNPYYFIPPQHLLIFEAWFRKYGIVKS